MPSKIEWTQETWNPVTGCTPISEGCRNCYARTYARRLQAMGQPKYRNGFKVTCHESELDRPLRWRKPRLVFVCSMSDVFHRSVPDGFILQVFETIRATPQHTYQILTKRSKRMSEIGKQIDWPPNAWAGVTIESDAYLDRLADLVKVPAPVRFVSAEPLLSPIDGLDLTGVHWVIVGCESGPGARPTDEAWARKVLDECQAAGVPLFVKQLRVGERIVKMPRLDGRVWAELPSQQTPRGA